MSPGLLWLSTLKQSVLRTLVSRIAAQPDCCIIALLQEEMDSARNRIQLIDAKSWLLIEKDWMTRRYWLLIINKGMAY
jgi:hypothetical protein